MTPRELAIIRCCMEPHYPHEAAAIIQERAFTYHGVELRHTLETLTALCESGHLSRLKKGVGKFVYRRTDKGQAELAVTA